MFECSQRRLTRLCHSLGANSAVELILDLQQTLIKLKQLVVSFFGERLIPLKRRHDRVGQRFYIGLNLVVANLQSVLG